MKKRFLCGLLAAVAVVAAGTAGLLWVDGAYCGRLAEDTQDRFREGVLLQEDFEPLTPEESMLLYQRTMSPIHVLSAGAGHEKLWTPYLPDYGSDFALTAGQEPACWQLSYKTLDGLEIQAYYREGLQEELQVYLPEPDLLVVLTGMGEGQRLDYQAHARRGLSASGLWAALRAELSYRL